VWLRILVVVAWLAALYGLAAWGESTPALIAAAAVTVIAGALVSRWWVLLVPVVPAVLIALLTVIRGETAGERWDAEPAAYAVMTAVAGVMIAFLLAVGVALSRLRS
jgi:hypothetical protein